MNSYPATEIYYDCVEDLDLASLREVIDDLCNAMARVVTRCDGLMFDRLTAQPDEYPPSPPPSPPALVLPSSPPPVVLFEDYKAALNAARKASKAAREAEREEWAQAVKAAKMQMTN